MKSASVFLILGLAVAPVTAAFAQACDPTKAQSSVSFKKDVEPLFIESCAHATCHVADGPAEELVLQRDYPYGTTIRIPSHGVETMSIFEPGNPEKSYLLHKLRGTHLEAGGKGERMPWGIEPLREDQIALIATWIKDCTPRN